MRRLFLIITMALAISLNVNAQQTASAYDLGKPIGWATVDGNVTGGMGGEEVVVTNFQEFDNAMLRVNGKKDTEVKRIIYVKGEIQFEGSSLTMASATKPSSDCQEPRLSTWIKRKRTRES